MRRGGRLPADQAELTFSDVVVEQLDALSTTEQIGVLAEIVALCHDPAGKHPLANKLAGWNTLDVLAATRRVVYKASVVEGVGLIEVLCLGPRRDSEVYDMAHALLESGILSEEDAEQLWQVLALLAIVVEEVGLDGWDYRPAAAPDGLVRAVVAAGLLPEDTARLLSTDELNAAMEHGWDTSGANPLLALHAALERARGGVSFDPATIVRQRAGARCGALMPRAKARCVRVEGHPGPHRAR